jgi:hypothetical protein
MSYVMAIMLPAYVMGIITGVFLEYYGRLAYIEKKRHSGD